MTLYEKELDLRRYIDISDHPYLKTLTNIINTPEVDRREFQWVSHLRKTLPSIFNTDDKTTKDMSGDASEITAHLLEGLNSSVLEYGCPDRRKNMKKVQQSIIFVRFASDDLRCIPHALDESMRQNHKLCGQCNKINKRGVRYGKLVVLNTARTGDNLYHNAFKKLMLHNIPQRFNIAANSYSLKFLIYYKPPSDIGTKQKSTGHYTCYCLIDSRYIYIDDMQDEKARYVDSSIEINTCPIVYWKE